MWTSFRQWVAGWLFWIAAWVDVPVMVEVGALLTRAIELTQQADRDNPAPGFGESKRHQVYARLLKEFPEMPKRMISRIIEEALEL